MADSEPVTGATPKGYASNEKGNDTLGQTAVSGLQKIRIKSLFVLFLILLVVLSDIFVNYVLPAVSGTVEQGQATTKGTFIQVLLIVIMFGFAELLMSVGAF